MTCKNIRHRIEPCTLLSNNFCSFPMTDCKLVNSRLIQPRLQRTIYVEEIVSDDNTFNRNMQSFSGSLQKIFERQSTTRRHKRMQNYLTVIARLSSEVEGGSKGFICDDNTRAIISICRH